MNDRVTKSFAAKSLKLMNEFSLQQNFRFITTTDTGNNLPSVNGLRAIVACWIITSHSFFYALSATDNLRLSYSYVDSRLLVFVYAALMAGDIFFGISGFLLAYNFYERLKTAAPKNLPIYTFKRIVFRYLRINPTFFVAMTLSVVIGMFLNDISQFIMFEDLEGNCKKFWWRNALFIQNFFPLKEMCMSWSW